MIRVDRVEGHPGEHHAASPGVVAVELVLLQRREGGPAVEPGRPTRPVARIGPIAGRRRLAGTRPFLFPGPAHLLTGPSGRVELLPALLGVLLLLQASGLALLGRGDPLRPGPGSRAASLRRTAFRGPVGQAEAFVGGG